MKGEDTARHDARLSTMKSKPPSPYPQSRQRGSTKPIRYRREPERRESLGFLASLLIPANNAVVVVAHIVTKNPACAASVPTTQSEERHVRAFLYGYYLANKVDWPAVPKSTPKRSERIVLAWIVHGFQIPLYVLTIATTPQSRPTTRKSCQCEPTKARAESIFLKYACCVAVSITI